MDSGRGRGEQSAVALSPRVSALERGGTASALNGWGRRTGFRAVTVGTSRAPVAAETPLELFPQSTCDPVPHPFRMVVPGGGIRTIAARGARASLGYRGAAVIASVQRERDPVRGARPLHVDVLE